MCNIKNISHLFSLKHSKISHIFDDASCCLNFSWRLSLFIVKGKGFDCGFWICFMMFLLCHNGLLSYPQWLSIMNYIYNVVCKVWLWILDMYCDIMFVSWPPQLNLKDHKHHNYIKVAIKIHKPHYKYYWAVFLQVWAIFKSAWSGIQYVSYNTGTRALPDIYALALWCCMPSGIMRIYIRQSTLACVITCTSQARVGYHCYYRRPRAGQVLITMISYKCLWYNCFMPHCFDHKQILRNFCLSYCIFY